MRVSSDSGVTGLVSDAIGAITRLIRDNGLMPGSRLPSEAALSTELRVSRTVVREALRSLAAMRIVDLAAGKRATVAVLDHAALAPMIEHGVHTEQISIQQIYDVRRTLEMRIAALAALRRTEAEGAALREIADAMRAAASDGALVMEHDLAFHRTLARASRNPVFALIVGAFEGVTRQTWPVSWRSRTTAEARDRILTLHTEIAAAVSRGEPTAAADAMGRHFDDSVRALLQAGVN